VGWRSHNAELIDVLDALVGADAAAYARDGYGQVANPTAPCRLRERMHQLAELIFDRDGSYPSWWRAVGEEP
jgi:hypothetical protein